MIFFNAASRRACALSDDKLTTGSVGIQVEFTFSDDDWAAAPSRIAVFRGSGVSVDVALLEDSCTVPPEVLTQPGSTLTIGVYGTDGAGTVVIPTVYAEAGQIKRGTKPSGVEPTPQTQPLIDQLLAAAKAARDAADEAERLAQSVRDAAEAGEFDGKDGNGIWKTNVDPQSFTFWGVTTYYYDFADLSGTPSRQVQVGDLVLKKGDTLYWVADVATDARVVEIGSIKGTSGASAYEIAVAHGYSGTEDEWLASLTGADAVVDPTLTNPGEAADAAAAGSGITAAQNSADYALLYAETLNSGAGIPLDAEWERGGLNNYGANDSRKYRARTVSTVQASVAVTVKAASGYQFFAVRYNASGSRIGVTDWLTSRELPVGESWRICVRAYPENADATADPDVFGAAITIQNNIGSGGVTVDDALSGSSTNPVQNKVVKAALDGKGTYSKPSSGIPKTDMAEDVQASLTKANTALQQHQDISGKADKVTEVTVDTDGAVTQQMEVNTIYHFTGNLTALTLILMRPDAGEQAQYHLDFVSGATAPTVTIPATVTMPDGWTVEANTRYEIDILDGFGVAQSWEVTA